jgi:curved DNA-binding protein CbpA
MRLVTYYEVLGVDAGASTAEIRRAFVRLARMHHPDRNASADAEARRAAERRMQLINEAWSVLGDEQQRAVYDHDRRVAANRPVVKPRRTPGTANPDFVPYDTGDDDLDRDFDPDLLDDTPYSSATVPRWLQLLAPSLLVAAVAFGSVAMVSSFPPFFSLAVVALIGSIVSFLVTPMLVVFRSSRRH